MSVAPATKESVVVVPLALQIRNREINVPTWNVRAEKKAQLLNSESLTRTGETSWSSLSSTAHASNKTLPL